MTDLKPVPIEVELWVALLSRPGVGSLLLAFPFGCLAYAVSAAGLLPTIGVDLAPAIYGVNMWLTTSLVMYLRLTKPY